MYLFILESIGTSELILIGIVALIIFGPRKLPQMARTIGKTMADFRKTTYEFKSTWEKEVNFAETESQPKTVNSETIPIESSIKTENRQLTESNSIISPEIKEISSAEAEKIMASQKKANEEEAQSETKQENDKRSWL